VIEISTEYATPSLQMSSKSGCRVLWYKGTWQLANRRYPDLKPLPILPSSNRAWSSLPGPSDCRLKFCQARDVSLGRGNMGRACCFSASFQGSQVELSRSKSQLPLLPSTYRGVKHHHPISTITYSISIHCDASRQGCTASQVFLSPHFTPSCASTKASSDLGSCRVIWWRRTALTGLLWSKISPSEVCRLIEATCHHLLTRAH